MAVGSLLPLNKVPSDVFMLGDKFLHAAGYAVVAGFGLLSSQKSSVRKMLLWMTFAGSVAIEFLQPFSGRSFEWWDLLANGIGVTIAIFTYRHVILPMLVKYELIAP